MKPLPPELAAWLRDFNELLADLKRQGFVDTPETAREGLARLTAGLVSEAPELACVTDAQADGPVGAVPLRIYHPEPDEARPLLVYLHGGGHMAGSIEVYDPICRKLALATGRVIVSVDYRLAPEHPYPAGIDDAEATLRQVFDLLETRGISFQRRLALGGDSGGGAMSATLAHRLQNDPEVYIEQQLLIYPSLDYTMRHASIEENGRGYLLQSDKIRWYFDRYLQHGEDREAVSPLHMEFTCGLPETMLVTAGYDPLRDEGLAYLEQLARAGIAHRHLHFDEQIHAFLNMEDITATDCREFYRSAGEFLRAR
ncbi:MAG: alpha/beta hydrolase fold domain-containing protein [Gammaproteobacteria bacterium]|nr:alpha/beta hydrolase fold domain-containing protein [Gammaproteobacteria bacterium]